MIRVRRLAASVTTGRPISSSSKNHAVEVDFLHFFGRIAFGRIAFWRMALFAAAGAIGTASQVNAAIYYAPDSESGFSQAPPPVRPIRQKLRHRQGKKIETPAKEATKPQGPLIIAISIEKQNLKVYDAKGFFAETPVSTGMRGHSTPMGVFSVIQKQKFHRSNIYSGAPMPYMQRITWSGVAMHAGVLPGYPASHGCIRMPMAFAVKMWGWTKMGARVVITPGEMTPPDSISHPLLTTQRVAPQQASVSPGATVETTADGGATTKASTSGPSLELKTTFGHEDGVKSVIAEAPASAPLRDNTHTADAGHALPANGVVSQSDATPSDGGTPSPHEARDVSNGEATSDSARSETESAPAETAEIASGRKPDEAQSSKDSSAEIKTTEVAAPDTIKAATDANPGALEVKKDQTSLTDAEKAVAPKPAPAMIATPKRTGQIAVLISRKDSRLYVRQNFAPLFDVPVTIAPSDRPFGTHVFTAQIDKDDANLLHWSVVSLPVAVKYTERRDEDERAARKRKMTGAAEIKTLPMPDSPAEAMDRLTIPAEAVARITEALSTGSSIVVSDQGIASGETGEGTDFIVSLR
jgi:lipoprotein-anchoring transpeptidase ErfK/SrfK